MTPSLEGTYTCIATNDLGSGNSTFTVSLYGAPPTNLTISSGTSTTATVSWLTPPGDLSDSLLHYQLRYWRSNTALINELQEDATLATTVSILLTDLEEYTEYMFEVRGVYENDIVSDYVKSSIVTLQDGKELKS